MKKLLVFSTIILSLIGALKAETITFTGVVDQSQVFPVGSTMVGTFKYQKHTFKVQRWVIEIGPDFMMSGTKNGGIVAIDNDPSHGSVYAQVFESPLFEFTLQTATPDGVIPPLELWNLNDWIIRLGDGNTFGHFTELPLGF
jgi:hypothetical protein